MHSFRPLFLVLFTLVALVTTACGGDDGGSTGPVAPPSLDGSTTFQLPTLSGPVVESGFGTWTLSCSGSAPISFTTNGNAFTGSFGVGNVICDFGGESSAQVDWSTSFTGTRSGNAITFTDGFCTYTGTLTKTGVANGQVTCQEVDVDITVNLAGSWSMGPPS